MTKTKTIRPTPSLIDRIQRYNKGCSFKLLEYFNKKNMPSLQGINHRIITRDELLEQRKKIKKHSEKIKSILFASAVKNSKKAHK